jgi:hypothetical protein
LAIPEWAVKKWHLPGAASMADQEATREWIAVPGQVVEGHRVASGASGDTPHPDGTIPLQLPHFARLGLSLEAFFPATLNVSIHPHRADLIRPRHTFRNVDWTPLHAPETFSFSPCRLEFQGQKYEGWVYLPHPETKGGRHPQPDTVMEIIAPPVPGIEYGSGVTLYLDPEEVRLRP